MEKSIENSLNLILTAFHFTEILKRGFSLDQIAVLKITEFDLDITDLCLDAKFRNITDTCVRKGLLTEDFKITLEGKSLIEYLTKEESIKLPKLKLASTAG